MRRTDYTRHLIIRRSTLPGAGLGLFTRRAIRKGERVVEYCGEIISGRECERRAQQDRIGYVLWINRHVCIDAYGHPEALGRYANDACGLIRVRGLRNNAEYNFEGKRAFIDATRDIPAGSEIFVPYGTEYWRDIRYNLRLEARERRARSWPVRLGRQLQRGRELAASSRVFCTVFVATLLAE